MKTWRTIPVLAAAILFSQVHTSAVVMVDDDQDGYTFESNTTYCVTGSWILYGTTTFRDGAVIKYEPGAYLTVESVDCQTTSNNPAIFTSRSDDTVGEILSDSTHLPEFYSTALDAYGGDIVLQHLKISYAAYGVFYETGGFEGEVLDDVNIRDCGLAVYVDNDSLSISNSRITHCGLDGYFWESTIDNVIFNDCWLMDEHDAPWDGYGLNINNSIFANTWIDGSSFGTINGSSNQFYNFSIDFDGFSTNVFGDNYQILDLHAPSAYNQTVSTLSNNPVEITLTANSPDSKPLTYILLNSPTNGTLSGTPPDLTYTPNTDYLGADSFMFTVDDGILDSTNATISIIVETNNPLVWPGLVLWLRADAGVTNDLNNLVSQWSDQTTNHNDATQSDTNNQPLYVTNVINGLPAVRFNGTSTFFEFPDFMSSAAEGEAFVVLKSATSADGQQHGLWHFGNTLASAWDLYPSEVGGLTDDFGSGGFGVGGHWHDMGIPIQPLTQFNVYELASQSTIWEAWLNGIPLYQTGDVQPEFPHNLTLGKSMDYDTDRNINYFFYGDIAEVLVFNRGLTSAERMAANNYLSRKYGLISILIETQPTSQIIVEGQNTSFSVLADGVPTIHYQWYLDSSIVANATNATLALTSVPTNSAGNYYVVVSNGSGSVTSSVAVLTVTSQFADSDYDGRSDGQEITDGTDPFNPNSVLPVRLGYWPLDDTNNWIGSTGQLPLVATNIVGIPSFSTNAALIDANAAILKYRDVETSGNANINLRIGTIRFMFKPDWNSGMGSVDATPLVELGNQASGGWWTLLLNADRNILSFVTQTNGISMTNLAAVINWNSNEWHQVVLTYSTNGSTLYLDGQLATNGAGVIYFPNADERTNGFRIGSDINGANQADGAFDELDTFNYQLDATNAVDGNTNGLVDWWEVKYFGELNETTDGDYDGDGTNNLQEFLNGADPNKISFSFSVSSQYITTNTIAGLVTVSSGVPGYYAVLVDSTNFSSAMWTAYASSSLTISLGSTEGAHDVWVGLRGLPADAQQTWQETTLILDTNPPSISITNPADNSSFNLSAINVGGTFSAGSLHQITVNGVLAFVNGTNFEAFNVPLDAGSNVITAVIEDLTGVTNVASITVIGLTNSDGSINDPVQLQGTPTVGFSPLTVSLNVVSNNAPGTFQEALYDFNGDGIVDFVTNNLDSVTTTYTNGEYFPTVTMQTDQGFFSSSGGWNSSDPNRLQITVQNPVTVLQTISPVSDPVDLKWNGTNLYVLSGTTGTITEFDTNGTSLGTAVSVGVACSGFDMDGAGNIYVAVTSSNQVWKFISHCGSFIADTNFGFGGFIGDTNGNTGTSTNEFNAPYDVAVSPDGGTISVSDSGNDRIQQFSTVDGSFAAAFGTNGTDVGEFNTPKGVAYDSSGTLYIVESNQVSLVQGTFVTSVTGTNGTAFGQFSNALNINFGEHGVYVADTGNNRIQSFRSPVPHTQFSADPSVIRFVVATNLNQPSAVAARDDDLTTEKFYVADTGNNQVLLYAMAQNAPTPAWNDMTNHIMAGDIFNAISNFSVASQDDYRDLFLATGTSPTISTISNIGALSPVYVDDDKAEYYFTQSINGQDVGFLVEFVRENGVWKILEF